jgi:hypothetical protein
LNPIAPKIMITMEQTIARTGLFKLSSDKFISFGFGSVYNFGELDLGIIFYK